MPDIFYFPCPPARGDQPSPVDGRGDPAALGDLYDRHMPAAYRLARAVCDDTGAAERALERAFAAIAGDGAGEDARGDAAAWLLGLVYRHSRAEARRSPEPCSPLAAVAGAHGEILALACFGELTHAQIAEHLDVPSGAVKHLVRDALHAFQLASTSGLAECPEAPVAPLRGLPAPDGGARAAAIARAALPVRAFGVDIVHHPDVTTVTVHGELDLATCPEAADALKAAYRPGDVPCIADLRRLTFLDVCGARLIARMAADSHARGSGLIVIPPDTGPAARMLQLHRMHRPRHEGGTDHAAVPSAEMA